MERLEIKVAKLRQTAFLPEYHHDREDSGLDVRIPDGESVTLQPGQTGVIPLGFIVQLPELAYPLQLELEVRPRSGLSATTGLRFPNSPGTIDFGYRGEISIIAENRGTNILVLTGGQKIAQLVPNVVIHCRIKDVQLHELSTTARGDNGFGSTGN